MKVPRGAQEIYGCILEIRAQKGNNSLWPGELFSHKFSSKSKIYGLPGGDILIKAPKGKKLWQKFKYDDEYDGSR